MIHKHNLNKFAFLIWAHRSQMLPLPERQKKNLARKKKLRVYFYFSHLFYVYGQFRLPYTVFILVFARFCYTLAASIVCRCYFVLFSYLFFSSNVHCFVLLLSEIYVCILFWDKLRKTNSEKRTLLKVMR